MSFLYPRKVAISRPTPNVGVGAQDYAGVQKANETAILANLPAKIEIDREGSAPQTKLAADAAGQSVWKILFKAPLGTVQTRDILTDDQGLRYQVIAAYWGPLVTTCRCQLLET